MLSGTQANIAIKLFGEDLNKMYSLGQEIKQAIADVDGITDVMVEQQVERAQLQIIPRREMLARYGITLADFSQWISVALEGETVSQIYDGNATFDLTVKVGDGHSRTIEETGDLLVDTGNGGKVPLSHIADIVSTSGPNAVNRENVKRKIVVSANITGGDLGGAVEAIKSAIDENIDLPQGYYIEYGGQFESQQSAAPHLIVHIGHRLADYIPVALPRIQKPLPVGHDHDQSASCPHRRRGSHSHDLGYCQHSCRYRVHFASRYCRAERNSVGIALRTITK